MFKGLTATQLRHYRRDGYIAPIAALTPAEAARCRRRLAEAEARHGAAMAPVLAMKSHLVLTCLDELVHHPAVLDVVEDVLGPNVLAWTSSVFAKKAHDPAYVSWHQDVAYWGLEPPDIVTAWIALTDSTPENGCMRVVPGTHALDVVRHRDSFAEHNMLSRGQEVAVEVDEADAVDLVLAPGQMSLHHARLIHGSNPNRSDRPRMGFAVRYVSTAVRQVVGADDSATLVRGLDRHRNFTHEPRPGDDFSPDALALHAAIRARQERVFFKGAEPPDGGGRWPGATGAPR